MTNQIKNESMDQIIAKTKLLYIESSKFDADWHSTLHSHPFTEFFYVLQGKGQIQFYDGSMIDVVQDDLLIINPNIVHTEVSDLDEPLEYIVLGIEGAAFSAQDTDHEEYSLHNYYEYKHEILFYLRAILRETNEQEVFKDLITSNLLNVLVMNIIRRSVVTLRLQESENKTNKDCIFIENYLNAHYQENITLDKLADLTFINKFYLSHIFKQHSGYSPIDYVLNKRLIESEKLLTTTDLSISQIASIVGFSSSSYFSQYFKKQHRISPSKYRENQKN